MRFLPTSPIDTAVNEIKKLQSARARLEYDLITDQAALEKLRSGLAEAEVSALLDGGDTSEMRSQTAALETRIAGRQAARAPLLARIREAIKAVAHVRAEALRKEAAPLQSDLEKHLARTAELLKALEQHAGQRYSPGMVIPMLAPRTYMDPVPVEVPKSRLMEAKINELLAAADRIESAAADTGRGGHVEATDLDGLLAVCDNIEAIAPTRQATKAWFREVQARADREWQRTLDNALLAPSLSVGHLTVVPPARSDVWYELHWDSAGNIDLAASNATNRRNPPPLLAA
jgi:hypothetical protein